eukprot:scaffold48891_cov61-Attheya_sp.AAC.1
MKGEGLVESVIMLYHGNCSQNSPTRIENKIGTFYSVENRDRGPWTVDRGPWTVDRGPWTV